MSRSRDDSLRNDGDDALLAPTIPIRPGDRNPGKPRDSATAPVVTPHRTLAGAAPTAAPTRDGQEIGGYEILEELARGGMGVVYKAYQKSLDRTVALKMVLRGNFAGFEDLVRFRSEAHAIARLHHPNLVSIYEIGEHDGLPYYAMEFLEGGSLNKRQDRRPLGPRAAAELLLPLARAIDYAHSRGIIHRDLKPANILFAIADAPLEASHPKITDFGIAKQLGDVSNLTRTGEILGTPAYMAPEQATGGAANVGPAADVYSLGAILYELLTGQPPFVGSDGPDTLLRVLHLEPVSPRKLNPHVTADLETICLKCLEKDPSKRYPTAAVLADDFERALGNEPILARPASRRERIRKWVKRRPVQATALALGALLAVAGVALIVALWQQAVAKADYEAGLAQESLRAEDKANTLLADALLDQGISLAEKHDIRRGLHWMIRSLKVADSIRKRDAKVEALDEAIRYNIAHWGQYGTAPNKRLPHKHWAWDVAFSPDGKSVVTASRDRTVCTWDVETGQPTCPPLVHDEPVWAALYHPSSKFLFTGSSFVPFEEEKRRQDVWTGEVRAYRIGSSGRVELAAKLPTRGVGKMTRSPRGDRLAVVFQQDGFAVVDFDPSAAKPLAIRFENPDIPIAAADWSADGKTLYLASFDGTLHVYDAERGRFDDTGWHVADKISALALSPDKQTLLVAGETPSANTYLVHGWNLTTGEKTLGLMEGRGRVKALAIGADRVLVAASLELDGREGPGMVRVVEFEHGKKAADVIPPLRHDQACWSVAFHPTAPLLFAGCRDGKSRIYDLAAGALVALPVEHEGNCVKVVVSPDGRQFATASAGGNSLAQARIQEAPRIATAPRIFDAATTFLGAQWLDDRYAVVRDLENGFAKWDVRLGRKIADLDVPTADGKTKTWFDLRHPRIVGRFDDKKKKSVFYDIVAGKNVSELPRTFEIDSADFNAVQVAGLVPVYDRVGKRLSLLRVADGAPVGEPYELPTIPHFYFSNEKAGLVGCLRAVERKVGDIDIVDGTEVLVWDVNFELRRSWRYAGTIHHAMLNPAGDAVAIAGDYQIELVDLATGKPRMRPISHEGRVNAWCFHPSGDVLGYGLPNGSVVLLHTKSSKPIGKAIPFGIKLNFVSPAPDGSGYLACAEKSLRPVFWKHLEPARGSFADLRGWVEEITGMTLGDDDEMTPIDAAELQRRRAKRR